MDENNIIIFDGVCNLCNWTVRFIIKRDPYATFKFASLQSAFGITVLQEYGYAPEIPESVLLLKDGEILSKSDAALAIASEFTRVWKLLTVLRIIPKRIRDSIYDWIARNRYRWFGKRDVCMVSIDEFKGRFI